MASPGLGVVNQQMIVSQSASGTTSAPVNVLGYTEIGIYVTGIGTTSSGVITIETADFNPATETTYTGTWSAVTTVNASDVTGGAQKHVPLTDSAYMWIRTRITTVIGGGGTISTAVVAV
jgi:hypothetical protein